MAQRLAAFPDFAATDLCCRSWRVLEVAPCEPRCALRLHCHAAQEHDLGASCWPCCQLTARVVGTSLLLPQLAAAECWS